MLFLIKSFKSILSTNDVLKFYFISLGLIVIALLEVFGLALISFLIMNLNNLDSILESSSIFIQLISFFQLSNISYSLILCVLIIFYSFFNILVSIASIRYISIYSQKLGANIKSKIVNFYLYLDWIEVTRMKASENMSRVINDGNEVSDILYFLMHLISKYALSLLIITLLLIFNTSLTVILVALLSLVYILIFYVSKPLITQNSLDQARLLDSIMGVVKNIFGSLKEIIFYGTHEKVLSNFSELNHSYAKAKGSNMALAQIPRSIIDSLILIALVSLLLFTQIQNLDPTIFFSTISIYGIAALKLLPAFQNIFYFSHEIYVRFPYLENISNLFLKIKQNKKSDSVRNQSSSKMSQTIEFRNISFRYPDSNNNSLDSINLSINLAEKIAIVGPSGSGKSTFIDIFLGFISPTKGEIYIDSKKLSSHEISSYRRNFAYVPQKIYFLEASLKDNISFGSELSISNNNSLDRILSDVELTELIANLPNGLETFISDGNQMVSGGQKQCIGIARALIRSGDILILDEATSSMDNNLEKKIYSSIFKSNFETIVSVTHNPSLLKMFDRIYVFRDGQIEDSGNFDDLKQNNSFFAAMLEDFSDN